MITEIAFTVYPVDDMARARAFYEGLLGLKVESDYGGKWVEYDLRGSTFALTNMMEGKERGTLKPSIAFEVSDLDATVANLRAAGVRFLMEPMTTPVCRMAVVADPEGNDLIIHQRNR